MKRRGKKRENFQSKKIEARTTTIKHHHTYQHGQITAQSYTLERPFDYLKFRHFVQVLLNFQGMRIHRMKGILNIHGQNHKIIFQSVQKQVVFTQGQLWKNNEKRISQLVVIGNGLKKAAFNRKLKQCVM